MTVLARVLRPLGGAEVRTSHTPESGSPFRDGLLASTFPTTSLGGEGRE